MAMHLYFFVYIVAVATVFGRPVIHQSRSPSKFENFGPMVRNNHKIYNDVEQLPLDTVRNPVQIALRFMTGKLNGLQGSNVFVSSFHTSDHNGVTHIYLQQAVNGITISNAVANMNIGPNGKIFSYGDSIYKGNLPEVPGSIQETYGGALVVLEKYFDGEIAWKVSEKSSPSLKYLQFEDELILTWEFVLESSTTMYNAHVSVDNNEVVEFMDYTSDASYQAFPLTVNDPIIGQRSILHEPVDTLASPIGWHARNQTLMFTSTTGNNVQAFKNLGSGNDWKTNYSPDVGSELNFEFELNLEQEPREYLDAAITNVFYRINAIHDLLYSYGFDEKAGNFQSNNFGRGGEEDDEIVALVQERNVVNNAYFLTPPDGQSGVMKIGLWTFQSPSRDGALAGDLIMHEYLHGVSIRLTGGRSNNHCLRFGESRGMGEGWGDLFAIIARVNKNNTRRDNFKMADYLTGGSGIRAFPYSTDLSVNPSTYGFITKPDYQGPHAMGEVWAVILYDVFWNIIEQHGFDPNWNNIHYTAYRKSSDDKRNRDLGGNIIFTQLVIDGMKLQPCLPTFVEARDSIIEADQINNDGENYCALWSGFAKRGLGMKAHSGGIESFQMPHGC